MLSGAAKSCECVRVVERSPILNIFRDNIVKKNNGFHYKGCLSDARLILSSENKTRSLFGYAIIRDGLIPNISARQGHDDESAASLPWFLFSVKPKENGGEGEGIIHLRSVYSMVISFKLEFKFELNFHISI